MNVTADFNVSGLGSVAAIRVLASAASTTDDPSARIAYVARARALLSQLEAELASAVIIVSAQEREIARVAGANP